MRLAVVALAVYAGLVLLYAVMQERIIFYPSRYSEERGLERAAAMGWEPWRNREGTLLGWRAGNPQARNRLVVMHGNAGSALDRGYWVAGFTAVEKGAAWEVYLLEYPGYGSRRGRPGEKALVADATSALEELQEADNRPVILLGESIGSGVACGVAARAPEEVAGLILVTPFRSLGEVARRVVPWMPVDWVLRHPFENSRALEEYEGPVAVLLAGEDEVVGFETGKALYDGYEGPKMLTVQEKSGHNTLVFLPAMPWWAEVTEWMEGRENDP